MRFWDFLGKVIWRAWSDAISVTPTILFLATVGLGCLSYFGYWRRRSERIQPLLASSLTAALAFVVIFLGFFVYAPYEIWQEGHDSRDAAAARSACLERQAAQWQDRTTKRVALEHYYEWGREILMTDLPPNLPADKFESYMRVADAWGTETKAWLLENLDEGAAALFATLHGSASSYSRAINPAHNNLLISLEQRLANLKLIMSGAWDTQFRVQDCPKP